ncbi:hypothetical protein [Spirulina sp. 06S082]|uniref:hypothetical protein n=1 Tax=Spirulina sp. 06S082 TaxID=3110248 RepID=UPI002B215468|nr:hypothetical protein [Spirulina sp. 06S082]MEA5469440.1 hypothetical protein [Spirulina sp. 06S082]
MNRFFGFGLAVFGLINVENGLANKQQIATNKQLITVNSSADRLQPDEEITLREAIALTNGTLSLEALSPQERTLVQTLPALSLFDRPRIVFNLPGDRTQIELQSPLPEIARSVAIDGTTQPGYVRNTPIPQPIVRITPASGREIMRGLTITGDRITIRGLHLYGFNATSTATERTPIADIFISHPFPRIDTQLPRSNDWEFPLENGDRAPKDIRLRIIGWVRRSIPPLVRSTPPLVRSTPPLVRGAGGIVNRLLGFMCSIVMAPVLFAIVSKECREAVLSRGFVLIICSLRTILSPIMALQECPMGFV